MQNVAPMLHAGFTTLPFLNLALQSELVACTKTCFWHACKTDVQGNIKFYTLTKSVGFSAGAEKPATDTRDTSKKLQIAWGEEET